MIRNSLEGLISFETEVIQKFPYICTCNMFKNLLQNHVCEAVAYDDNVTQSVWTPVGKQQVVVQAFPTVRHEEQCWPLTAFLGFL